MKSISLLLRIFAVAIFGIAAMHIALGPVAETWLGAELSAQSLLDPVLDSQNRFYGAAFALFGVALWLASTDLKRYGTLLELALWVFFAGGLARLLAILNTGWPSTPVVLLTVIELAGPPLLIRWKRKVENSYATSVD